MKRISIWLAGAIVGILTVVANAGAASASQMLFYESDVPKKLRR
ncbi:cyclic lactone autoinducer peptide [Desulfitispora alkaliphila]